jgi:transcriptional regulator with XRE-family HTH domain
MIVAGGSAGRYFLDIYATLSGVCLRRPAGQTFARRTGRPFLSLFKKLSSIFFSIKKILIWYLRSKHFYFYAMKTKKPGPPKGQKHIEVKRSVFGERLYKIRKARGITQQGLGDKIGVTKRVVAFYEGDHAGPTPELLQKLAIGLNVSVSHLLGDKPISIETERIPAKIKRSIDDLKVLPLQDQKTIFRMIELAKKEASHRKAV